MENVIEKSESSWTDDSSESPTLEEEEADLLNVPKDQDGSVVSPFSLLKSKTTRPLPLKKDIEPLKCKLEVLRSKTKIACMYRLHAVPCPHSTCRYAHENDFDQLTNCRFGINCRDVINKTKTADGFSYDNRLGVTCVFKHEGETLDS